MSESDLKAQLAVAEARLHALTRSLAELATKWMRDRAAWIAGSDNPLTEGGAYPETLKDCADELQELLARVDTMGPPERVVPQPTLGDEAKGSTEAEALRALGNCYMMAKREIARIRNGKAQTDALSLERWQHVQRFCEDTGLKSSILRASLPTEITDGSGPEPAIGDPSTGSTEPKPFGIWQPIATAPKDGTRVLFKGFSRGGSFSHAALVDGWIDSRGEAVHCYSYKLTITHWMPLPAPPPSVREENE